MVARLAGADDAPALVEPDGTVTSYRALRSEVATRAAAFTPGVVTPVSHADPRAFLVDALAVLHARAVLLPLDHRGDVDATCARVGAGRTLEPAAALVLSTSGSSGHPKAVLLGAAGVAANIDAILAYLPIAAHPRTAIVLPFAYSYALVGQALTTLAAGGAVLLLAGLAPPQQVDAMRRLGASGLSSVPASLRRLAALDPPPLGYVASAGAPLTAPTRDALRASFPDARHFNQYGLTEASPRVAACCDTDPCFAAGAAGFPLRGTAVDIHDGEVYVRGPSVMLRYLDDPDATAAALTPHGLRTGDRGFLDDDGALHIRGRIDDLVKIAGERVGLDEVANNLRALPGVLAAAVVALPDPRTDLRLVAGVVLDHTTVRELRPAMRAWHPARRPRLVALESLPTNARGKLDRPALRAALSTATMPT